MKILGIETSCDETSISIVDNGVKILSNIVASQVKTHNQYFGVVPELASRLHLENINFLLEKSINCIDKKHTKNNLREYIESNISAIAYTYGPGLMGSLLIGQIVAQTLSYIFNKPIIPVNHLEGHIFSAILEYPSLKPPFLALIISGGHTELVIVEKFFVYKKLGQTRDDACGEAFDKVAKLLNLSYPGGPVIEKNASKIKKPTINFPRPYMWGTWDFSFSGLKTAVVYYVKSLKNKSVELNSNLINDICASFQQSVIDTVVTKTITAAKKFSLKNVVVVGGVAANSSLKKAFINECNKNKLKLFSPRPVLCTDNAAMIASAGYFRYKFNCYNRNISVDCNAKLLY